MNNDLHDSNEKTEIEAKFVCPDELGWDALLGAVIALGFQYTKALVSGYKLNKGNCLYRNSPLAVTFLDNLLLSQHLQELWFDRISNQEIYQKECCRANP